MTAAATADAASAPPAEQQQPVAAATEKRGSPVGRTWRFLRTKTTLTQYIILGTVLGLVLGGVLRKDAVAAGQIMAAVFLRPVMALIAPLIFSTLVAGIAGTGEAGDAAGVGRRLGKTMAYFVAVTTVALVLGLLAADTVQPGAGVNIAGAAKPKADGGVKAQDGRAMLDSMIQALFPQSFFEAASKNQTLSIVMCAIIFAIGSQWVKPEMRLVMIRWCQSLSEIMFQVTYIVMLLAPIGVMGALMAMVGEHGFGLLQNMALLVGTLYGALIILVIAVYLPILVFAGRGRVTPRAFVKALAEPMALAFFTTSSQAALPLSMRALETTLGVPQSIVALVLPLGCSFNLAGATLYLPLAMRFAAQFSGVHQGFADQLIMLLVFVIVSKGGAAVPRASIVILLSTCGQFRVPEEGILLTLGVDAFMDMGRTVVNLLGNCLAAIVIAKWEGVLGVPDANDAAVEPDTALLPLAGASAAANDSLDAAERGSSSTGSEDRAKLLADKQA